MINVRELLMRVVFVLKEEKIQFFLLQYIFIDKSITKIALSIVNHW